MFFSSYVSEVVYLSASLQSHWLEITVWVCPGVVWLYDALSVSCYIMHNFGNLGYAHLSILVNINEEVIFFKMLRRERENVLLTMLVKDQRWYV